MATSAYGPIGPLLQPDQFENAISRMEARGVPSGQIDRFAADMDRAFGGGNPTPSGSPYPPGFFDPTASTSEGGGGGGTYLPPVSLPRLGMPSEMELAKLAYSAVDASRMPFNAQRANLQAARTRGMNDIAAAQRDARTGTVQAWDTWRNATSGLEDRVGSAYQSAAAQLAANMNAANASLLARGFRPQAANPEMLAAMGALGANAQSYASTRRMQGEDARANALSGVSQIDQAARGTMASTYSSVLGQIAASAAAAEAQARLDTENRIFELRRQVEQANNQTAIQEALANSGR